MPETTTTELTSIEAVRDQNLSLVDLAGRVEVIDSNSADRAGRLLMQLKAVRKSMSDARMAITRPLDEAKKRAIAQENVIAEPIEEAIQHLDGQIKGFAIEERRRVAREQAEAEARRAELEIEAQIAAEEGRLSDAAELQLQRDATGTVEKAHRAAGTQARFTWVAEVTDLDALVRTVAENAMLPSNFLTPNQSALNAFARATAGKATVPGLRFVEKPSLAATARA